MSTEISLEYLVLTVNKWIAKRLENNLPVEGDIQAMLLYNLKKYLISKGYRPSDLRKLQGRNLVCVVEDNKLKVVKFTDIWKYSSGGYPIISEMNSAFRSVLPVHFSMQSYELQPIIHNVHWRRYPYTNFYVREEPRKAPSVTPALDKLRGYNFSID